MPYESVKKTLAMWALSPGIWRCPSHPFVFFHDGDIKGDRKVNINLDNKEWKRLLKGITKYIKSKEKK